MKDGLPRSSLIISSRNRPKLLRDAVHSVLQGEDVPTELIIVDQSDEPNLRLIGMTSERLCEIRYIRQHAVGVSRARNCGIEMSKYDVVAIIDDDMIVTSTWYGRLIRALCNEGPRTLVTGRVLPAKTEVHGGFVPATVIAEKPAEYQGRIGRDVLAGGHMASFRKILQELGGFDERLGPGTSFPAAEDNDLGFRAFEAKCYIVYVPEAILYHRAWRRKSEYLPMRWRYGCGKGGFYGKHLCLRDPYMFRRIVSDVVHRLALFPYRLCTDPFRACGDFVYIAGLISGITRWTYTH